MGITINDIARIANVSRTTISRVLNNKPDVSLETRERILSLIKELDYHPNAIARGFARGKSSALGLIISDEPDLVLSNPFFTEMVRGIARVAYSYGYNILLFPSGSRSNYVELFKERKVEGLILTSPVANDLKLQQLIEARMPFVATSKINGDDRLHYVDVDNLLGAYRAVEYLLSLGHTTIGFISGPLKLWSSMDRMEGYKLGLKKHSIPYHEYLVVEGDHSFESGFAGAQRLLGCPTPPTAIFAASDLMAIGVIQAVKSKGLKIPEDISVMGFDGIQLGEWIDPPLTTIRQPVQRKGVLATKMLIKMIEQKKLRKTQIVLAPELVIRKSCGDSRTTQ